MIKTKRLSAQRGMTLLEMMIALVVFSIIVGGAFSYVRSQSVGFRLGSERMDALQNLRFTANVLELDLRTLGSNVPDEQPMIIYAGNDVFAFNADYTTNVADDAWSVYYDPDAPTGSVTALRATTPITIPNTSFSYPSESFPMGGAVNSPAETIVFFFRPDSSTARDDDYVLYRKVNRDQPELVSRNLLKTAGLQFFEYFWLMRPLGSPAYIEQVPSDSLPLMHSAPYHGAPSDTNPVNLVDDIRGVRVNFTTTNGKTGAEERLRTISRTVRLPNAGLAIKRSCGDAPILGISLTAVYATLTGGEPVVNLSWNQAVDEGGGESDVTRYVIWRRDPANADWGDPYLSIPSGQSAYTYQDQAVAAGERWIYALAAQDCTPMLSGTTNSAVVNIP